MVPLLRSCTLSRKILFAQEIISIKRVFVYSTCSDVKKQTPITQGSNSYENNENEKGELVYNGSISSSVQRIKGFSLISSIISIMAQPILCMKMIDDDNIMSLALTFVVLNFIAIGNPFLIYLLTKRYVTDMYFYPKERKYVAEVFNFFFRKRKIEFTPKDVNEHIKEPGLFTTCYVKKYPLLFDPIFTTDCKHYFIIMGYKKFEDFEVKQIQVPPINKLPINKSHQVIESKSKEKQ